MRNLKRITALLLVVLLMACSSNKKEELMMATTTSMNDSGVLDALKPEFEKDSGIELKWTSVGSGEAIKLARDGEADVLFAHSPKDEDKLVADGVSLGRNSIMYNNFLIVGPKKLEGSSLKDVAKDICDNQLYVSRADESGTHKKEITMFEDYCGGKKPKNYLESSAGMLDTLNVAAEKKAYTLVDYATWLENKDKLDLVEAYYNKEDLINTYSVHVIKTEKTTDETLEKAEKFKEWVTTGRGRELIKDYGMEKFKEPLFTMLESK